MLKRITLFTLAFIGCMAMNAQIFSEDFSGVDTGNNGVGDVPSGWSTYDLDGLTPITSDPTNPSSVITDGWNVINFGGETGKVAVSTSYYTSQGSADDWMVTPEITLPSGSNPFLFFNVSSYDISHTNEYEILVSTTGNTPSDFGTPEFSETQITTGGQQQHSVDLSSYAGQDVYIAFHNMASQKNNLLIYNVLVKDLLTTDLETSSINTSATIASGDNDIKATVSNNGADAITSFDATWSVDGGTEHTQTISGVDIGPLDTYDFTHQDQWDATTGDHTLTVAISNVNGNGDDDNSANDAISKDVTVASGSVQKRPLYEEFTSSYCPPCASWNSIAFEPFFQQLDDEGYEDNYSLVKYAYWIPDADPYFTNEGLDRGNYYGINADPTMYRDGVEEDYGDAAYLSDIPPVMHDQFINTLENDPSFFDMEIDPVFNGANVDVTVNTTPFISGDYTLRVAIVEKHTTGNTGANGETDFYQVMMKMLPDAEGTPVSFVDGEVNTQTFSVDLTDESIMSDYSVSQSGPYGATQMAPHVEEYDDLQVVAWIQNDNTGEIMQSSASDGNLSVGSHNKLAGLTVYPNPSNGTLNIATKTSVNVVITDMMGKQVFAQKAVDGNTQMNISDLSSGVYFVNMSDEDNSTTKKLIVK